MSWATLYSDKNIAKWKLPASASLSNQGYTRGLVITWTELQKQFRELNPPPDPADNIWYVVCDVLILDDSPIVYDQLYLFARRIEVKTGTTLTLSGEETTATIVCQEITNNHNPASLHVSFNPAGDTATLTPNSDWAATIFSLSGPTTAETSIWTSSTSIVSDFGDNLYEGEPLRLGMVSIFQVASLLASSRDSHILATLSALNTTPLKQAINQLEWVAAITDIAADTRTMAAQARAQLVWLIKESQGLVVVPPLDFSVYRDTVAARISVLKSLSSTYDRWVEMKRSNVNWLSQAQLTVALKKNEIILQAQLEKRASSKLNNIRDAESEASVQLRSLEASLNAAHFAFEAGVNIWKRHNEMSAAFKLIFDVVKFGVAVGQLVAMVAAPGAGAASAGKASSAAKSVAAKAGEMQEMAGPLGEVADTALAIAGDAKKLIKIGKTADVLHSMANDTLKQVNTGLDKTFTVSPLKGLDTITGGQQVWESLRVAMDDAFSMNSNFLNKISGGPEFRIAFRQLVIGAEAYCSARLAVAEASNQLAEAKLRTESARKSIELAANSLADFKENDSRYEQLQMEAFERILDAKRAVRIELEQYQQASYYFTLSNAKHSLPSITAPVSDFIEESASISGLELILEELSPMPQALNGLTLNLPISNQQKNGRLMVVQLDASNAALASYARIRIDKIKVSLMDANSRPILVGAIKISTSGVYKDKVPSGGVVQFSGDPFIRTITYDNRGNVLLDSGVYARFEDVIFKPTPFTTWTFQLPDVSTVARVTSLQLMISGAASPVV